MANGSGTRRGFALIGDAAKSHDGLFGGERVNKAMRHSLSDWQSGIQADDLVLVQAVLLCEQLMFPCRAAKIQAMTMNSKRDGFGPDAPIGIMTGMLKTLTSDSPSVLIRTAPVVAAIYSSFWIRM